LLDVGTSASILHKQIAAEVAKCVSQLWVPVFLRKKVITVFPDVFVFCNCCKCIGWICNDVMVLILVCQNTVILCAQNFTQNWPACTELAIFCSLRNWQLMSFKDANSMGYANALVLINEVAACQAQLNVGWDVKIYILVHFSPG